jgi:HupE/UreJ protein
VAAVWVAVPAAHDIPNDVTVQTFLKPEGSRLRLLVRVPLQAMRDMDYPKPRGTRNTDLLDLARAEPTLRDAATLWVSDYLDLYENGVKLPPPRVVSVRAALQSDKSFASYDEALAHLTGAPLPETTEFFWSQGLLDVLFEYPIQSETSRFSIDPRLARLGIRTLTVLRFLPPGGAVRGFEFLGDPGVVLLDPRWHQAALQFVKLGFQHILDGTDHLLFLVCLVIPFRRFRSLVAVVTAFTVAHSITLIASAYNLAPDALWFPPLIETLIATSIVYMALENIVFAADRKKPQSSQSTQRENDLSAISASSAVFSSALKRRWLVTFGFGLVHGFGFSFALRQTLQFAGSHLLTSLLSFNIGVELGQLLVLAILIPALNLLFRFVVDERTGTIMLSAIVAHTAWHWLAERWELLRKFTFTPPPFDAAFLAAALRWMMLVVVAAGLYWLVFGVLRWGRKDMPTASRSSTR